MAVKTTALDAGTLSEIVERERERFGVPGVEVVVVRHGEVVFAGGFGVRNVARSLPVTSETVFAHASTGKAATAFLIGQLVDEGLINLDEPIRTYLPEFRLYNPVATDRITLRDFLCHRSGLPAHDLAWLAYPEASRAELVRRMCHLPPNADLRASFQYCNWGYVLAGQVAGVVTGSSWEEQMRKRVFGPLGLKRTYVDVGTVRALEDHADPYQQTGDGPEPIAYRDAANVAPAGGIMSCADDVARWLMLQLNGGELDGTRLISEASLRQTHTVQSSVVSNPAALGGSHLVVYGYGMGWGVMTYRQRRFLTHGGGIDGFTTEFDLLPDEKIGVAVSNNISSPLPGVVARNIIDHLLGAEAKDWGKEAREQIDRAQAVQRQPQSRPAAGAVGPSHRLSAFAGTYTNPAYGDLVVALEGDALGVRLGTIEFASRHRHFDTWALDFAPLPEFDFWANFVTDETGAVAEARTNFAFGGGEIVVFTRRTADG